MLGEDTLLFTRKGFKKLKELNLYDEVLTSFGDFEPIIELGPWKECTYELTVSTGETFYCDDDILWDMNYSNASHYIYELKKGDFFGNISPFNGLEGERHVAEAYNYAVVVPSNVPEKYILSDIDTKLAFLAGLIDSPICMLGQSDGIYEFYTRHEELVRDITTLVRSLGLNVYVRKVDSVWGVSVYLTKYIDIIPIHDDLKQCEGYANSYSRLSINDIKELKNDKKLLGRNIRVNRGHFLIGYSFVTVS